MVSCHSYSKFKKWLNSLKYKVFWDYAAFIPMKVAHPAQMLTMFLRFKHKNVHFFLIELNTNFQISIKKSNKIHEKTETLRPICVKKKKFSFYPNQVPSWHDPTILACLHQKLSCHDSDLEKTAKACINSNCECCSQPVSGEGTLL